jgi:hypothetical protein
MPGDSRKIEIMLERQSRYKPNYHAFKRTSRSVEAGYWIILGDRESNKVLAIKRI